MSFLRNKFIKNILYVVFSVVITISVVYIFMHFIARPYVVDGDSMNPTLYNHDFLIVNRLEYRISDPERYDLIVFPDKNGEDIEYVKRIIGLPGETVQIMNGKIYINAQELNEFYGKDDYIEDIGNIGFPIALGPNEYFVLGDNRNDSIDSRNTAIGIVNRIEIVGRAGFRLFPLNSFGSLKYQ